MVERSHGTDRQAVGLPFVRFLIVAFHLVRRGDTVEAPDSEDHVVDYLDGEVAARIIHIGNVAPTVRRWLVFLSAAHP